MLVIRPLSRREATNNWLSYDKSCYFSYVTSVMMLTTVSYLSTKPHFHTEAWLHFRPWHSCTDALCRIEPISVTKTVYFPLLQRQSCKLLLVPPYALLTSWCHACCRWFLPLLKMKKSMTKHKIKLTQQGCLRLYKMHSKYLHLPYWVLNSCFLSCHSTLQKHCLTTTRDAENTTTFHCFSCDHAVTTCKRTLNLCTRNYFLNF